MIASPSRPLLAVSHLTKSFILHGIGGREVHALEDVNLQLWPGEAVAIAGPSGAGKSSLLKCIYRTYVPSAGTITFRTADGKAVELTELDDSEMADLREREIGYVSQFLRAEPRRGALDVVVRAGKRRGLDEHHARHAASEMLAMLNLAESLWSTYPTLLSGGEQQRVNLAAAMLEPPRLLLLDEPVASLDAANRASVFEAVSALSERGVTILAVFHDQEAIECLTSRVVWMEHGRVVSEASPTEVVA